MAAATMYVTVSGAGDNSGSSWGNAMAYSDFFTDITSSNEAGDIYYIEEGSYTMTADLLANANGSATAPIKMIGVKSGTTNEPPVYADYATGTNRPSFGGGDYYMLLGTYYYLQNIQHTITDAFGLAPHSQSLVQNCKGDNGSVSVGREALGTRGDDVRFIECEGICDNGAAIANARLQIFACYVHDSSTGIEMDEISTAVGCVVDTCTTGFDLGGAAYNVTMINNTIYNCTTGISGATSYSITCMNNIIDACTTGASWTSEQSNNWFDHNCWDNTTDVSNVTKGNDAVTLDPGMTDPANADFSISDGDNADDVGADVGDLTGATV